MSKFLKSDVGNNRKSIKLAMPTLARPRRADYLLMTKSASINSTEDQYGLRVDEVSNLIDFKRALEIVEGQNATKKQRLLAQPEQKYRKPTWQSTAISSLDECDRWVFGGKLQKLWPYKREVSVNVPNLIVVYPAVFTDAGFEEEIDARNEEILSNGTRWDNNVVKGKQHGAIFAVLPLVQIMGAFVTSHLHHDVTHILCQIKRKTILKWTSTLPRSVFVNPEAGEILHERLLSLEESAVVCGNKWKGVLLVSPDWVEENWNQKESC